MPIEELRCEKCFITYDELLGDGDPEEALWMCLTHYCFICCPQSVADKVHRAFEGPGVQ